MNKFIHIHKVFCRENKPRQSLLDIHTLKQIVILKLTVILTLFFSLSVSASHSQSISINAKQISLEQALQEIKKQSGYAYLVDSKYLVNALPVTVEFTNFNVEEAMIAILADQPFTYSIKEDRIILKPKAVLERRAIQKFSVKGKVIAGLRNLPLEGASLKLLSSGKTYITNRNGEFTIEDVIEGEELVVSFVGYETTRLILTKDKPILSIVLKENANALNEVLVSTGYQKIKKELLTGAYASVNSEQLEQRTITSGNFLESLEGQLAGLVYNNRNPNTPADEQLTIRGVATFNGVKQPLIVIDGFPTDISLSAINPDIIASVTILKDAAASTIYGARAANGVIVIETKKGSIGAPQVSFTTSYSMMNGPDFNDLNLVNSADYIAIKRAKAELSTASRPTAVSIQFDPVTSIVYDLRENKITEAEANQKFSDLAAYNNLDEYTNLFYRTSLIQNHQLSLSGGNEGNNYRLGINYVKNKFNETHRNDDKITVNLKDIYAISDRFTLEFSGIYSHRNGSRKGDMPGFSTLLPYMRITDGNGNGLPNYGSLWVNDEMNALAISKGLFDIRTNPYNDFINKDVTETERSLRGQAVLNAKIIKGLDFDIGGAYDYNDREVDELFDEQQFTIRDLLNRSASLDAISGTALFKTVPRGDLLKKQSNKLNGYTFRSQLNANYTFGKDDKHEFYGILGAEVRKIETDGFLTSYFGYDPQTLISQPINMQILASSASVSGFPEFNFTRAFANQSTYYGQTNSDKRFRSFYSQATYIYNKKYILTGSARIDQSNLFGTDPESRNKPQWSAGLSWLVDKETFMEGTKDWLTHLKLRGAYGLTGNVPTSNGGKFVILGIYSMANVVPATVYHAIKSPENQSITWENTQNLNLGIDFGLLNNRVSGSLDVYSKKSDYVLGTTQADPSYGWISFSANTAKIDNKGMELSLNIQTLRQEDLSWNISLTGSFNKNEIKKVYNADPLAYKNTNLITASSPIEGYALNTLLSYDYTGLNEHGIPMMRTKSGEIKTLNSNDGIFLEDLINSGTATPKYVSGMGHSFRYKNFELYGMFMYYGGHVARVSHPIADVTYPLNGAAEYWRKPGDELHTDIPVLQLPFSDPNYGYLSYGKGIYRYSQASIRKADQINLRDIVFTYHIPSDFTKKISLSETAFRFQVQNAWRYTFSGNDVDMDAINPMVGTRGLNTKPSFIFSFTTNF